MQLRVNMNIVQTIIIFIIGITCIIALILQATIPKTDMRKKYLKYVIPNILLFTFIMLVLIIVSLTFSSSLTSMELITLIPGDGLIDVIILFFICYLSVFLGALVGNLLAPLFLKIHLKLIGRNLSYGIEERKEPLRMRGIHSFFFPVLLSYAISLILIELNIHTYIFFPEYTGGEQEALIIIASLFLLFNLTIGASIMVFSTTWALKDAGIVYNKKEGEYPAEIKSVGVWYLSILKGYTGIEVLLSIVLIFISSIRESIELSGGAFTILQMAPYLLQIPMILGYVFLTMPAFILLDRTREKRKTKLQEKAKKWGIKISNKQSNFKIDE